MWRGGLHTDPDAQTGSDSDPDGDASAAGRDTPYCNAKADRDAAIDGSRFRR